MLFLAAASMPCKMSYRNERMFNGAVAKNEAEKEKLLESWLAGWLCGRQLKKI